MDLYLHETLSMAPTERPLHLKDVALASLEPVQRALLTIDGTVTTFLEAYHFEPIVAANVTEDERALDDYRPELKAGPGTAVVDRQICLVGEQTGTVYAYAKSVIIPDRLPQLFRDELRANSAGIGAALLRLKLESRREFLWYGNENPAQVPTTIQRHFTRGGLVRCYRVIAAGSPVILIRERFPR